MIKRILLLALAIMLCCSQALARQEQEITPLNKRAREHFDFAERVISYNGQKYKIFIAAPKAAAPRRGNPVLYLLDGNAQFPLAVNSYNPINGPAPLIVGIGYDGSAAYFIEERTRDYTVPAAGADFKNGGGAEAFYQFIQNRVRPFINSTYKVDKRRQTLMGHSYGGLFTLYVLFNHTDAFQRYVAASPSIWWGNGCVIPKREKLLNNIPQSLTISIGEYEGKPNPDPAAAPGREARLAERGQAVRAHSLASRLQNEGAPCVFIEFQGKDHGSVIPDALAHGVFTAAQ